MGLPFRDRAEAGRLLAEALSPYRGREDAVVLGLPRGGVVTAFEVARALDLPLDVIVVRKIGLPGREELAMGAVGPGGVRVLNRDVIGFHHVSHGTLERAVEREVAEIRRREREFRGDAPPLEVEGRTVLVVDDGAATGATIRAAVAALRRLRPARVVAALPVASTEAEFALEHEADEFVCLAVPEALVAVGAHYDEFPQTSDGEVRDLLRRAAAARPTALARLPAPGPERRLP
jgi:putative phosphoribosyl transferase